jgi:hypothetical protein
MPALQETAYFRRIADVFAGLDRRMQTETLRMTVRNVREQVAIAMAENVATRPDEPWAIQCAERISKLLTETFESVEELEFELYREFSERLNIRREEGHQPLYGFYEFSYCISIAYKVIAISGYHEELGALFINSVKHMLMRLLHRYLLEAAPKIMSMD